MQERNGQQLLLIVDGNMYAHRAFYAIAPLSSPDGQPTNAVYGFIKMLQKLIERLKPTHLLVVWDGGLSQERKDSLPEYKTNRPPMPKSLESQIDLIFEYLKRARIPSFYKEGVEADDWIATVATKAAKAGIFTVIASADKDFMQLVSDKIGLVNPNDRSEKVWRREDVVEKTGVTPEQIVDWLSLVGDSVDNIPGVEGIGIKTASNLLHEYGSIEAIFENIHKLKSEKTRNSLLESKELIERNRDLIRLYTDMGGEFNLDNYKYQEPDEAALKEFYKKLGFKSLLNEEEAVRQGSLFENLV
ncbi:MAG: 5'-3' exonuclease [Verrucomicrobiia bacterium]